MADLLSQVFGKISKRYKDMGDGSHAEVVAVGAMPSTAVTGPLTAAELAAAVPGVTLVTATIAQGESESAEVDLGNRALIAVITPAEVEATTAQISIKHGHVSGTRHVRQKYGVKQAIEISTTNRESVVDPADYPALRYVSIVAETSAGVAVAQATAAREFVLVTRAV